MFEAFSYLWYPVSVLHINMSYLVVYNCKCLTGSAIQLFESQFCLYGNPTLLSEYPVEVNGAVNGCNSVLKE